jgi:hypothetical protein
VTEKEKRIDNKFHLLLFLFFFRQCSSSDVISTFSVLILDVREIKMNKSMFKFISKLAVLVLCILGLIELGLALWTVLEGRYKSLAYNLADVGYIVSMKDFQLLITNFIE